MKNIKQIKSEIEDKLQKLDRSIVATPTNEYLESFTKANGGSSDFLLVQLAKNYGYKLALEEIHRLLDAENQIEFGNRWLMKELVYETARYYEYDDVEKLFEHVSSLNGGDDGFAYIYTNAVDNQVAKKFYRDSAVSEYSIISEEEMFSLLDKYDV